MRILGSAFCAIFAMFVCSPPAEAVEINTATIEANNGCNIIIQNSGEGAQTINSVSCPGSGAVNVRYVWLNQLQASLFIAGHRDESFERMLGKAPFVFRNEVLRELEYLLNNFGVHLSDNNALLGENTTYRIEDSTKEELVNGQFSTHLLNLAPSVRRKLKVFPNEGELPWPDLAALTDMLQDRWPSGYLAVYSNKLMTSAVFPTSRQLIRSLTQGLKKNWASVAEQFGECMMLYQFVSKSEFDAYWDNADRVEASEFTGHEPLPDEDFEFTFSSNPTWDMLQYVTRSYWPQDFLYKFVKTSNSTTAQCGLEESGGIYNAAVPRRIHVLVAVVEPVNEDVVVEGLTVATDRTISLRNQPNYSGNEELPAGSIKLSKSTGNTVVLPLQIEFRYEAPLFDDRTGPSLLSAQDDTQSATDFAELFRLFSDSVVAFTRCNLRDDYDATADDETPPFKCTKFFESKLSTFPRPTVFHIPNPNYIYGPTWRIDEIKTGSQSMKVRDVPQFALYADGIWESGSCPFVSFEMADGRIEWYGRLLKGASRSDLARLDRIIIPAGAKKVIISEIEPEISHLMSIALFDGAGVIERKVRPVTLLPRKSLVINVTENTRRLDVFGYYEQLSHPLRMSARP